MRNGKVERDNRNEESGDGREETEERTKERQTEEDRGGAKSTGEERREERGHMNEER